MILSTVMVVMGAFAAYQVILVVTVIATHMRDRKQHAQCKCPDCSNTLVVGHGNSSYSHWTGDMAQVDSDQSELSYLLRDG